MRVITSTFLALAAGLCLQAQNGIATQTTTFNNDGSVTHSFTPATSLTTTSRADDAATYEIKYKLICDETLSPAFQQFLMPKDGSRPFYGFLSGGEVVINAPAGVYDALAVFTGNFGSYIVVIENVTVSGDAELTFDTAEAVNHIKVNPMMPNGSPMTISEYDPETWELVKEGNFNAITFRTYVTYPAYGAIYNCMFMADSMEPGDIWTNNQSAFTFRSIVCAFDDNGGYLVEMNADGSSAQTITNNPSTYAVCDIAFAGSELSESTVDNLLIQQSAPIQFILADAQVGKVGWAWSYLSDTPTKCHISFDADRKNAESDIIYFQPAAYYAKYNYMSDYGINAPIVTDFSNMSMGVTQMNVLISPATYNGNYAYVQSGRPWFAINPVFSYSLNESDYIIGNSCPVWVPYWGGLKHITYTFTGRGGDIRDIDILNHNLNIKIGGKDVIDSNMELLANNWEMPGFDPQGSEDIDITVMNHNLMVDGITRINGEASLHIDRSSNPAPAIPTVQMLQFRDEAGHLADRLDSWQGAEMLLAAGAVKYDNITLDWQPLSDIKVEWAPYMSGNFRDMTVEKDTDTGFMPTFGWLYRADMSQVMASDTEGWHDLRVTVTADNGSVMTQTISPAFCIGKENGIERIVTDSTDSHTVSTDGDYYNLSGRKCDRTNLVPGLYIVTDGATSRKVVVR